MEGQIMSVVCVESDLQNTKHADNSSDTEIEDMMAEGLCDLYPLLRISVLDQTQVKDCRQVKKICFRKHSEFKKSICWS